MCDPRLRLPAEIYALPGYEINIYYQNIITVINPANYAFDIECGKGRCDQLRWRWIPEDADVGIHPMKVSVWTDEGMVAEAETKIIVSPRNAGDGKKFNLLVIGASVTAADGHIDKLYNRFQSAGNPELLMLGSQAPGYGPARWGGPAHEAYGGWNWRTFFEKKCSTNLSNDGLHPARPWDVRSPFLNDQDEFDFPGYLERVCKGVKPDIVCFELGVNGIFLAKTDEEFNAFWDENIYPFMKKMILSIKEIVPDVKMGVMTIPKGAWSADAFGKNYGCQQSRRRWLVNADMLALKYIKHAEEFGYKIIPGHINMDGDINYPKELEPVFAQSSQMTLRSSNALHPTIDGYNQWADSEYFFLKHLMAE